MKRLNVLLLSAVALGMTVVSCTKDDKKDSGSVAELKVPTGTWVMTKVFATSPTKVYPEANYVDESCTDVKAYYNFKADGTLKDGYVGTQSDPCAFNEYDGSWTQTGNVVNIVEPVDNYTVSYTLVSVSANTM